MADVRTKPANTLIALLGAASLAVLPLTGDSLAQTHGTPTEGVGKGWNTAGDAQLSGLGGWEVEPLFTVGESVAGYQPVGILDGIGAIRLDRRTVRVYVNHEIRAGQGYAYTLANGLSVTGARVSFFDIHASNRKVLRAGLAYHTIVDRAGNIVTAASQINENRGNTLTDGIDRLCSSYLAPAAHTNFEDDIYFAGEETGGGQEFALDVAGGVLYCAPMIGRAAFENVTWIDTGDRDTVGLLIGDDRPSAALLLYIGRKNAIEDGSFLDRNGLATGALYVWVADNGDRNPSDWRGTGSRRSGTFVEIPHYDPAKAGAPGYDALGFANQATQDAMVAAAGGFRFSRPEDVATSPADGTQVVLASTGRSTLFGGADRWGTTYIIDIDAGTLTADISIIYDGDDAGGGQFAAPDYGLRNPDNLDWADDGRIFVQEDRSFGGFGSASGEDASIFEIDPDSGVLTRVARVNRTAVTHRAIAAASSLGEWETSGILDVTELFRTLPGERLMILDVQAHTVRGPDIVGPNLVQGGQLVFLSARGWPQVAKGSAPVEAQKSTAILAQNTPNPFNLTTTIRFELENAANVSLAVYNVAGERVRALSGGRRGAGIHSVQWDGRTDAGNVASSGVYFYRLQAGDFVQTKRMMKMD